MMHAIEQARQIANDVIAPRAAASDRDASWPEVELRALQAAGLGGLVVSRDHGGLGGGLAALARVCEVLGTASASVGVCFGMHCVATAVIAARATDDQAQRYLVPIAEGKHLTTIALSEPASGARFYLPTARMTHPKGESGTVRIHGEKAFVTSGGHADSYVVSTATASDDDKPLGRFSCVVVPAGAPGLEWSAPWQGWGLRGNSSINLKLSNVAVPVADLLGQEGDQMWFMFRVVFPHFLMAMAGTYLGVAAASLELGREHLTRRRYADGRVLADNVLLQHRFGVLWADAARARSAALDAAARADAGDAADADVLAAILSAKADVSESVERVTGEVMTLMGGTGYREGSMIQRLYRDARAAHVMTPTTDVLRTWAGRTLLGLPLLGE
jgi:alkylation response protein AidB-like acyl-CoA dehydrogenase